jgi:hypothetical protein
MTRLGVGQFLVAKVGQFLVAIDIIGTLVRVAR